MGPISNAGMCARKQGCGVYAFRRLAIHIKEGLTHGQKKAPRRVGIRSSLRTVRVAARTLSDCAYSCPEASR